MHKNMHYKKMIIDIFAVTFREEGVDWNKLAMYHDFTESSHLPRGRCGLKCIPPARSAGHQQSPSARKVWIEIELHRCRVIKQWSHLPRGRCGLKWYRSIWQSTEGGHLPRGRCGLKFQGGVNHVQDESSPSARKVWIEISRVSGL